MLDIQYIRDHRSEVERALQQKKSSVNLSTFLELDEKRRALQKECDDLQAARHALAEQYQKTKPTPEAIEEGKNLKERFQEKEKAFTAVHEEYEHILKRIPNIPSEDTPIGASEEENVVLREHGEKPSFSFSPRPHWEIGEQLGLLDTERAARVSGARFVYLKGDLARLQYALIDMSLQVLTNESLLKDIVSHAGLQVPSTPFIPVVPPELITEEAMDRMARLEPRDERYKVEKDPLYLIGSAEHALGTLHMDEVLAHTLLPLRYVGVSSSFRREAGSYGRDTRGILRLHQFQKIEMESFTTPEMGIEEQNFFVAIQEYLLTQLELPYRVVITCTADMGDPDARHIDLETWFPGQNTYRETHSADYMTDYQSRRLRTKIRHENGKSAFAHMNDGTVLAIGRTIAAILENYQTGDGAVRIPAVLRSSFPGQEVFAVLPMSS